MSFSKFIFLFLYYFILFGGGNLCFAQNNDFIIQDVISDLSSNHFFSEYSIILNRLNPLIGLNDNENITIINIDHCEQPTDYKEDTSVDCSIKLREYVINSNKNMYGTTVKIEQLPYIRYGFTFKDSAGILNQNFLNDQSFNSLFRRIKFEASNDWYDRRLDDTIWFKFFVGNTINEVQYGFNTVVREQRHLRYKGNDILLINKEAGRYLCYESTDDEMIIKEEYSSEIKNTDSIQARKSTSFHFKLDLPQKVFTPYEVYLYYYYSKDNLLVVSFRFKDSHPQIHKSGSITGFDFSCENCVWKFYEKYNKCSNKSILRKIQKKGIGYDALLTINAYSLINHESFFEITEFNDIDLNSISLGEYLKSGVLTCNQPFHKKELIVF